MQQTIKQSEEFEIRKKLEAEEAEKNAKISSIFDNVGGGGGAANLSADTSAFPAIGLKAQAAAIFDEIEIKDDDTDDVKANKE